MSFYVVWFGNYSVLRYYHLKRNITFALFCIKLCIRCTVYRYKLYQRQNKTDTRSFYNSHRKIQKETDYRESDERKEKNDALRTACVGVDGHSLNRQLQADLSNLSVMINHFFRQNGPELHGFSFSSTRVDGIECTCTWNQRCPRKLNTSVYIRIIDNTQYQSFSYENCTLVCR